MNITIEARMHDQAKARAEHFGFRGGFSEYVARLIAADRKTKGRTVNRQRPR